MFESAASIHPILTTRNLTAHPIVGGNHDSIKGSMTHLGEGGRDYRLSRGKRGVRGGRKAN